MIMSTFFISWTESTSSGQTTEFGTKLDLGYAYTESPDENVVVLDAQVNMQYAYLAIGIFGTPNMLIINQSLVDFAAAACILFSTFFRDIDSISSSLGKEVFCRVWLTNLPMWGLFVSSTYNLVALTYERYIAIVHPLVHNRHITRNKIYVVIGVVWFIGPFYQASFMIKTAAVKDGGSCSVYSEYPNQAAKQATGLITVVFQFIIPLFLIIYAYSRIAYVLRGYPKTSRATESREAHSNNSRDERMTRARRNTIKTLVLVSACFVFCWSWNQIFFLLYNLDYPTDFTSIFYHFTVITVFCNCCLNPIVYACKYKQFQKAVIDIFCKSTTATDGEDGAIADSTTGGLSKKSISTSQSPTIHSCFPSGSETKSVYTVEQPKEAPTGNVEAVTTKVQLNFYTKAKAIC